MKALLALGLLAIVTVPGYAQVSPGSKGPALQQGPVVHRITVTIGGGVFSGAGLGGSSADLRGNGTQAPPYQLFHADTRFDASPLVEARVGVALSRRIIVEARGGFNRPELRTSVSADVEGAPAVAVVERIDQYAVGGSVVVMLHELRLGGMVPFAAAGAGYLRQLHDGLTLVEHGHTYDIGGGVTRFVFSRDRGFVRAAGLRADARLFLLSGGVSFDKGPRSHAAISGSAFVAF